MINLKKNSYLQVKNVLCEGTVADGDLHFSENVKFDGRLTGDLHCDGDVVIGEPAVIAGNITAQNVMISGSVTGNVTVAGQFCLTKTGRLRGNVQAVSLLVEEGGIMQGMSESRRQTAEPAEEELTEWDEEEEIEEDDRDEEEAFDEDIEDWDEEPEEDDWEEAEAANTLTASEAAEVAAVEELLEQEVKAAPIKGIFGLWQKE